MTATTIVVSGALAAKPGNGGEAWVPVSWVRGLRDLGFDVWYVEEMPSVSAAHAAWFRTVVARFGLHDRAVLSTSGRPGGTRGVASGPLDPGQLTDLLRSAALLVNISGALRDPALVALPSISAYVDLDPGFTQVWVTTGIGDLGLDRHDLHFTVGLNIGTSRSPLPTGGYNWLPCRQPYLEADWPVRMLPDDAVLTTVAAWRCAFGPVEWNGVSYGLKLHEFRRLVDLPSQVTLPLELALSIDPADGRDLDRLREHGWRTATASDVAATPDAFADYVAGSLGELSAVQGIYAHGVTGWFSDRSVRYLATGRPVVVQDTGLEGRIPIGEGLLTFSDLAGAARAVRTIADDPERHAAAAAALAREHFAAPLVLGRLVEACGVAP